MTIGFDLGHDHDLEFSRSNMEFAISQPKMVWLPRNEKQTYRLISRPQMWPSGLTLAMTLTFEGPNMELAISLPKIVRLLRNKKQTHWLNARPQIRPSDLPWPWPWPWIFKVKYEICYISTKSGPIATKRKANVSIWTLGLKCDQWVWPWPWPWYLNFQGHMWSWLFGDQGQV